MTSPTQRTRSPTDRMIEILEQLSVKGNCAHWMGGYRDGGCYFLSTTMKRCTEQIHGLRERGLVEKYDDDGFGSHHKIRISKKGREFLDSRKEST